MALFVSDQRNQLFGRGKIRIFSFRCRSDLTSVDFPVPAKPAISMIFG